MASELSDARIIDLNDTIIQLNKTITTQNDLISSLRKEMEEREKRDATVIANLQAQLDFLKNKLFGSTSEKRKEEIPGQLDLFSEMHPEEAETQSEL